MRAINAFLRVGMLVAIVGLAACASTPAARIAQAEVALTAADQAATAYVRQPACAPGVVQITCSDMVTVAKIKVTAAAAYDAVKAAKRGSITPDDAVAAVAALTAIIPVKQ